MCTSRARTIRCATWATRTYWTATGLLDLGRSQLAANALVKELAATENQADLPLI